VGAVASLAIIGLLSLATIASADTATRSKREFLPEQGFSYPPGEVCPFPVRVDIVRNDQYVTHHYDQQGNLVSDSITGALVVRVTNTATGTSVERNLAGKGIIEYNPDGSLTFDGTGHFLAGFHGADSPRNQLLVFSGHTIVDISATGRKTLVSNDGAAEDLCVTLAG
jgi:hypothetical protein